ncbi:siderophore-iron reductase FhuF [Pseudoalteromonas sp. CO348]|uniref:(2Fe-2S)-binding protein n=1 Tax=unclassified Pseudoalteromonas TaxID=194690 RepID=UPI001022FB9D|nr:MULTISPECIES: (2Fe-2S)-binding protein [unclassified Pseudoalteromonas]MCG7541359.1 (2Fe-2S)-binding protein [Pseudoalteromonas sp. OF7H-1]RZG10231.1 siderophore-iron reductase FhuF [Pseudoalteromonas sp. CO348]
MLPILKPYLPPPLDNYARGVALISGDKTSFAQQIKNITTLSDAISRFSSTKGVTNKKAQASVWHMHYTLRIMPSILFTHSVLGRVLPLALDKVVIDMESWQLQLPNQGRAVEYHDTATHYAEFIDAHLAPLHAFLNQQFGVAEHVLSSNCAFRLRQFFPTIIHYVGERPKVNDDYHTLSQAVKIGEHVNPFYTPELQLCDERGPYQLRESCCLLHKTSDGKLCRDCPKHPHHFDAHQQQRTLRRAVLTNSI